MAKADDEYKKALKNVENLIKKQEQAKKSVDSLKDSWSAISSELFKIDGAAFFKEVPKSRKELEQIGKNISEMKGEFDKLGTSAANAIRQDKNILAFKEGIGGALDAAKASLNEYSTAYKNSLTEQLSKLQQTTSELSHIVKSEQDLERILKDRSGLNDAQIKQLEEIEEHLKFRDKHEAAQKVYSETLNKALKDQKIDAGVLASLDEKAIQSIVEKIHKNEDLGTLLENATIEEKKFIKELAQGNKILQAEIDSMIKLEEGISQASASAKEMSKSFDMSKAIDSLTKNLKTKLIGSITQFDNTLNDVQKRTSINMDENSQAFSRLTVKAAQFGVSVEQAGELMANMSSELHTTDFNVLSKAAEDFMAIEGATGAAAGDISTIAGEMMRMGASSAQVKESMGEADKMARQFGVSSAKVINGISKNIKKMREMGFTGGEKSLAKMAITAERLKMNMDETFDMAKRARSIEGAMDMAAELQLAGGSFSNINPMDLLAAARKGPEELQKILTKMGGDIGKFDEKTGQFQFDPVDVDRLQMVSDATGQSMESLQNMIKTNAEDAKKTDMFGGMLDGLEAADQELAKSGLSQMLKVGEGGKIELDASSDMAKRMGVDSLEELQAMSGEQLKEKMNADQKTLEEQNKKNQSMSKSIDNLMTSLASMATVFQPVIEIITTLVQGITSGFQWVYGFLDKLGWFGTVLKWAIPALLLFGTSFGSSVMTFVKDGISKVAGGIKNMLPGGGGGAADLASGAKGPGLGVGAGLTSLADGLKSMGSDFGDVMKGILAVAAAGPAFLLFVPALPGLLVLGLVGAMGESVTAGFEAVASGLISMGEDSNVFKGILATALAGVALLLFTPAIPGVLAMALVGALSPLVMAGFNAISTGLGTMGQNFGNIMKGSLAIALVGLAILPFVLAANIMSGVDWTSVLAGVGVMALVVLGLMGIGMLMAGPQMILLLLGVGTLILVGASLLIAAAGLLLAANAFQALGAVDWGSFSQMGEALGSVVPGMLGFSLAAMLFANPISLLGLMFMTSALGGLVSVMAPLAESLTIGADSLDRFASGLEKLSEAANKLSVEKLEQLKELSETLAGASAGGAMAAAMANVASALGGKGKGGDGEVRKIEVNVKMNGRELQNFIVKDTAIVK